MRRKPWNPSLVTAPSPPLTPPSPPGTLGEPGRTLWDQVQSEIRIDDAAGVELLTLACEAKDKLATFAARIADDGPIIATANGPKAHPLLNHEHTARSFIVRTLAKLGIVYEDVKKIGRPSGAGWRGPS